MKRIVIAVVVLALADAGWFAYQQYGSPKAKPAAVTQGRGGPGGRAGGMRAVLAERAHKETFGGHVEAIGTLVANESVTVTAKTQGIMRRINFEDGQTVRAGEEIAAIDSGVPPFRTTWAVLVVILRSVVVVRVATTAIIVITIRSTSVVIRATPACACGRTIWECGTWTWVMAQALVMLRICTEKL